MTATVVIGAQWGDEGKGKITDMLAAESDVVARYGGGDNAGHTVVVGGDTFKLHLVPSGILYPHVVCVLGGGMVVNPRRLLEEMDELAARGVDVSAAHLLLSSQAHLILPYHIALDGAAERSRGRSALGTTKRGIGPAYADKSARSGLRIGDLLQPDWLEARLDNALRTVNRKIEILGGEPVDGRALYELLMSYRQQLGDHIIDTVPILRTALANDAAILLEGQLGVMRDLDWGIYPYVTSSNPTASFAPSGAGLPANSIDRVVGVVKAYSTAVGDGPFPTELFDADGEKLRQIGQEFGATTGRPRRCGWFDGVAINYAAWLNGMTGLAITKLDVLDHFETLKICTGYRLPDGEIISDSMPDTPDLYHVTPVYETWEGWLAPTEDCRSWDDLPKQARAYIHRLSELAGVKVDYVSVGPERDQMFAV